MNKLGKKLLCASNENKKKTIFFLVEVDHGRIFIGFVYKFTWARFILDWTVW